MFNGLKKIFYSTGDFSNKPILEKLRLASVFFVLFIVFLAPLVSKNRPLFSGGIFIAAALLSALFLIISYFRKIDNIPTASIFLTAFVLFSLISSVFSPEKELSLVQTSYFASWLIFFYCGFILRENKRIILLTSLFSAACVLVYSLWQYFVIFPAIKEHMLADGALGALTQTALAGRLFSTFQYPNSFAAYLIMISGPVLTVMSVKKFFSPIKFLALTVWFFISFSIYLTSSRLGITLWALSFLSSCAYLLIKDRKKLILTVVFALTGFLSAYSVNKFNKEMPAREAVERISTLSTDSDSKLLTLKGAFEMTLDNPLTGTGPGTFKRNYSRYRPEKQTDLPASAHNIILDISSTAGIPASVFFAVAVFAILLESFSYPLVFFSLSSLFLHSLADWDFSNIGISLVFFFLAGAHSKRFKIPLGKTFASLLMAFCLLFSFFSARSGIAGKYYERASFHLRFGSPESASFYARKASEINPSRSDYPFLEGLSERDPDSAANAFKMAAERAPQWYEPYYHLARISLAKGDLFSAKHYFRKAIILFPTSAEIKFYVDSLDAMWD
ncbi:O-antigen ligase family protein [candidate division WOR-3 bacterium]|nr:O-antigen ligase family protein [candidate division WOR-3 bacterium]